MRHEHIDRAGRRETRARSGVIGRHSARTGSEPATARSALSLRLLLAGISLPVLATAAVLFSLWAAHLGPHESPGHGVLVTLAAVCGALALTAVLDLYVVTRRLRRER
ncbi:DUF6343 family protein [Streptomyces sp. NPDC057257]|uniref:DUF6343 family protein n=1 Tax=Streptomyces sp. NPDC057257 TaxID=3346071 RepID=UPI0036440FF0